ncbi:primase-like DNA-binding domain-containing protein, partial [Enterococcus sp. 2201sp1_2201st1_B8_2201SCRN_220225]
DSMEYVLNLAIAGLKRLMKNKKFSPSKTIEKETSQYEVQNNPILGFLEESDTKIENEITTDVYQIYQVWCVENGYQSVAANTFSREINRMMNLEIRQQRIDGKKKRIFVKKDK